MKIAFLTPSIPYPANSGGKIKTYKMLEYLSSSHSIDLYTIVAPDHRDSSSVQALKVRLPGVRILDTAGKRERTVSNFLKSIFYKKPLSVYRNYFPELAILLEKNIDSYDLIFVDHFLMWQYIPFTHHPKTIVHQHNAEYVMWERYTTLLSSFLKRTVLRFETERIKKYERNLCAHAKAILAAPNDQEALQKLLPNVTLPFFSTLHLADEELLLKPQQEFKESNQLLYVGTLSWEANWDGLVWFLEGAWSKILAINPAINLVVIGKATESQRSFLLKFHHVEVKGFVDNLDEYFYQSQLFIAPLRFGSGIKVKVIEALYRGMAIVTTSVGAEGIGLTNDLNVIVADDLDQHVRLITNAMSDSHHCNKIANEARKYAQSNLRWSAVLNHLERAIQCR